MDFHDANSSEPSNIPEDGAVQLQENANAFASSARPTGRRIRGFSWAGPLKERLAFDSNDLRQIQSAGNGASQSGFTGGLNGGQAKVGKLIIKHKGQQMLDLVVAANVVMFFRGYKAILGV